MKAIWILALTCGFSAAAPAADEQLEKSLDYFLPPACVGCPLPPLSAEIPRRVTMYTAKLASQCPPS
jgi:hypothetical protein